MMFFGVVKQVILQYNDVYMGFVKEQIVNGEPYGSEGRVLLFTALRHRFCIEVDVPGISVYS
jgi:hypothetical protein